MTHKCKTPTQSYALCGGFLRIPVGSPADNKVPPRRIPPRRPVRKPCRVCTLRKNYARTGRNSPVKTKIFRRLKRHRLRFRLLAGADAVHIQHRPLALIGLAVLLFHRSVGRSDSFKFQHMMPFGKCGCGRCMPEVSKEQPSLETSEFFSGGVFVRIGLLSAH